MQYNILKPINRRKCFKRMLLSIFVYHERCGFATADCQRQK